MEIDTLKYDRITALSFNTVLDYGKGLSSYKVRGIDPKNKEHLFLLTILKYTNSIYNLDIYLSMNWFKYWKLKRNFKIDKIKPTLKRIECYEANDIIASIYENAKDFENFTLKEIYEAYYEV